MKNKIIRRYDPTFVVISKQDTLFDAAESQQRYHKNPFAIGDACAVAFCTTHGQNIIRK